MSPSKQALSALEGLATTEPYCSALPSPPTVGSRLLAAHLEVSVIKPSKVVTGAETRAMLLSFRFVSVLRDLGVEV